MSPKAFGTILAGATLSLAAASALAQSSVTYGRITAVRNVTVDSSNAQVGGALVGGTVGLVSGSNRSSSNQALRGIGGAAAGRRIGGAMGSSQATEFTILMGNGTTTTMVTDQVGKRIGDCVAVERGSFNNLRLVDDARCAPSRAAAAAPAPAPAPAPAAPAAIREADACNQAKEQLLAANTDDEFDRAERRVRLLCGA